MHALTGNYEVLFSKRAKIVQRNGFKDVNLSESDF